MDAVKFLEARNRMCKSCGDCVANANGCCFLRTTNVEEQVAIVEQWAKEHPAKTRQSEFLRLYPEAQVDEDGIPGCPQNIKRTYHPDGGCADTSCYDCRREFWMQEVE